MEEEYYDDEYMEDEYDDDEEFYAGGSDLPWWIKKSPSVLISIGFHTILLIICAYLQMIVITEKPKTSVALVKNEFKEQEYDETLERAIFKTPKIICDKIVERPIIMLEEEVEITQDIPKGTSFENMSNKNLNSRMCVDAYGIGGGAAGAYGSRFGKGSLVNEGGSKGTESAVTAALRWLLFHQDKADGKWDGDDFMKNCKGTACTDKGAAMFDVGLTGLALLAFLGNGHTHRGGQYRKTVRRGLKFLKKMQQSDGQFGGKEGENWIYNHAIATMALGEAYAITHDFSLKNVTQKAVTWILDAQNDGLAWRYTPRDGNNDTSVTGWMVLALKTAKAGGIEVPDSAFKGARNWFDRVTASNGRTGYLTPGDRGASLSNQTKRFQKQETMTGVAIICRIFTGQDKSDSSIKRGVELLMDKLPDYDKPDFLKVNYYYWYNATYAMFQIGGGKWKKWNTAMKKALLDSQRRGGCADGSWDSVGEWGIVGGRVYSTAINALTLEIYYRFARANIGKQ